VSIVFNNAFLSTCLIRYFLANFLICMSKRQHNLKLTGVSLSEGLEKYSEIGYEYIELVQSIIRQNKLSRFDY
jgi:uncharacterized FlgJ-related protein